MSNYTKAKQVIASVGSYVNQSSTTRANYNWRMLSPIDIKLGTLIHINVQIIPIAWHVSASRSFWTLLDCQSAKHTIIINRKGPLVTNNVLILK